MGRARQPVNLLVYNGKKNLTKKEIEERSKTEVKAPSNKVKPPSYLTKDLKKEFKKIASELVEIGIMTNLDNDGLARFLIAKKMYLEVTDTLMEIPPTISVPNFVYNQDEERVRDGMKEVVNEDYSKTLINQDKLFKQCRTAASDLGLTISSRCRLVVPKPEEKKKETKAEKRFGDRV